MISKPWIFLLVLLDISLWVAAMFWPTWRGETHPLSVMVGVWPGSETIVTAGDRGLLPDSKINMVEMIWSSAAVRAFENRVADAAVLGLDEALRIRERNADVKIILVFDFSISADVILAKPEIKKIQDLRGKKIGVSTRSSGMYLLRTALEDADMTPEEMSLVPINVVESETAFTDGELDAVSTCEPWSTRLVAQGAVRIVDSTRVPGDICRVLVVRTDAIRKHREALQTLVNAHFEMLKLFKTMSPEDPAFTACSRREGVSLEELAMIFKRIDLQDLAANRALLDPAHGNLESKAAKLAAYMLEHDMMKKPVDCRHLTDNSFVQAVP